MSFKKNIVGQTQYLNNNKVDSKTKKEVGKPH